MPNADTNIDLRSLDWKRLVSESSEHTCESYIATLDRWLTGTTIDDETKRRWKVVYPVIYLRAMLDPEQDPPFLPADMYAQLDKVHLQPLVAALELIDDAELRSRIIDIGWQKRVCTYADVSIGVTAYIETANRLFEPLRWVRSYIRLKRAIELGASLGKQSAFKEAVAAIEASIERAGVDDPLYFVERLMKLLLRFRVGDASKQQILAHELASRARALYERDGIGNGLQCERERVYLELEQDWATRAGDDVTAAKATLEIADAYIRQAEGVIAAKWPAHFGVAVHFVGKAIEQLKLVGGQDQRIARLRHRIEQLQRASIEAIPSIPLPSHDFSDIEACAREHVAGKSVVEALLALAFVYNPPSIAELENEVRASAQKFMFHSLIPAAYLGPRGATRASHGGVNDSAEAFDIEVIRAADQRQQIVATKVILPAMKRVMDDYNLETAFFVSLAALSGFIPKGRAYSYGKGLAAGARGDFDVAAALLFPQIEHAIRELFFENQIVTTTSPANASQNEYDLNRLLLHEALPSIFGEKQAFDLRVLLVEKAGANLRNDLAHGVLDDGARIGSKIYFWWLCLRFVCMPLIKANISNPG